MFLLLQNVEWQPPHFKCHFIVLCPPLFRIRSHQSLSIVSYMKYECIFLPPYFQDFLHLIFSTFSHIYYSDSWICKLVFFIQTSSDYFKLFPLYHSLSSPSGIWTIRFYNFLRTMFISEHFYVRSFCSLEWVISTHLFSCSLTLSSVVFNLLLSRFFIRIVNFSILQFLFYEFHLI